LAVSRTDIIEYVWGNEAVWEESDKLDVYIANLRKKLDKSLIQTIK
jgi:DNA-binding response OmpR family regulator